MSFYKSYEYKKFEREQKKQAEEYRKLGMTEEAIQEMYEFDRQQFLSNMKFYTHNQSLDAVNDDFDCDEQNPLIKNYFDSFAVYQTEDCDGLPIIEIIEDEKLKELINSLSIENQKIIEFLCQGCSVAEISKQLNISERAIYRRVDRIKKKLDTRMSELFPDREHIGGEE